MIFGIEDAFGERRVKHYALNQEKHHQKQKFEDEYIGLLMASVVDYEETYLW